MGWRRLQKLYNKKNSGLLCLIMKVRPHTHNVKGTGGIGTEQLFSLKKITNQLG